MPSRNGWTKDRAGWRRDYGRYTGTVQWNEYALTGWLAEVIDGDGMHYPVICGPSDDPATMRRTVDERVAFVMAKGADDG